MITKRYLINAAIGDVWKTLTDPQVIEKWGAGPAVMKADAGFEFSLWGGDVWGKNLEVQAPSKGEARLTQEWYGGEWEIPSIATFKINEGTSNTEIILEHSDVPKDEEKDISAGWDDFYLGPIKKLLEK